MNKQSTIKKNNPVVFMLKSNIGIISVMFIIAIGLTLLTPKFMTVNNVISVLRQISNNVFLALGMTMVIILGGIDLSVGSIVAMSGTLTVGFMVNNGLPMAAAIAAGLLLGAVVGLVNGIIVATFKVPAFIVTLATMNIAKGIAYIYSKGQSTRITDDSFAMLGTGYLFGIIPLPVAYMILLIVVFAILLGKTKFGTYIYAVGGNRESARLSGVPIKKIEILVFTITGVLAAFAGIVLASRMYSGQPASGCNRGMCAWRSFYVRRCGKNQRDGIRSNRDWNHKQRIKLDGSQLILAACRKGAYHFGGSHFRFKERSTLRKIEKEKNYTLRRKKKMEIFRKPSFADSTGDAIPFYHDGIYHIFSLTPPTGTTVYPERLRTTWSHTVSKDLIHWEELETALYPGEGTDPDADGVWTGSVIYGEGKYHIYYTGYNYHIDSQQTICHAVSNDGIHWIKDVGNPVIKPIPELYETLDWRDPYVFYNEDDDCYWILISGRLKEGPPTKTGCIVLYRSRDLKTWEHYGPIYKPYHTNCPECCEMYKINGNWYLSYSRFSEFVNTIYRVAKSPFGPWRTPKMDGIGGRRFYAAKSCENDEGRRFYFAWAHDRARKSDMGEWYWGGAFCIPHEVTVNKEGELDVKMPREYVEAACEKIPWMYEAVWGTSRMYGPKTVELDAVSTFSYGFLNIEKAETFLFRCKLRITDCRDYCGLLLKSNRDASRCLELRIESGMKRLSLVNLPMDVDPFWRESCTNVGTPKNPGPDGIRVCEKPFLFKEGEVIDVKVVMDKDMVEIFIGERAAFTYRVYEKTEYEIGFMAQDGKVEFFDIEVVK